MLNKLAGGYRLDCFVLLLIALVAVAGRAHAQDAAREAPQGPVVNRGDAVVTGFAGTLPPGPDLPLDIHPLDRTTIDLEGATVRVFDLSRLGGGPEGQLSDAPVKFTFKAKDVGHVFGVAFDGDGTNGPPNIYLTATSVFGLQLVAPNAEGRLERIMTGRPGAQWMSGLFGDAKGGGPGSIWKVDGRTGEVSLFADIRTGDLENSGAGLGSIAFDARSRHLYVSDMETGLVWRLDLTGKLIDVYDHGTQGRASAGLPFAAYDPATRIARTDETFNTELPDTWGFAPPERRVWALAIENNRLYYSVADGPAVWSVGLNPDGTFASDARLEIEVKETPAGNQLSTIVFDGPAIMYLAQRGGQLGSYDYASLMRPQESMAIRYKWNEQESRWAPAPEEYAVGLQPEHYGAVGGLALNYGYDRFGNIDYGRCRQTLWLTGEHLRAGSDLVRVSRGGPPQVHGLQGIYKSRVRPDNAPPFEAWYVDYDAQFSDEESFGHVGNVAVFNPCEASATYSAEEVEIPVWTKGPNVTIEKHCYPGLFGGRVQCQIVVRNTGDRVAGGIIEVLDETRTLWGDWGDKLIPVAASEPDGAGWTCSTLSSGAFACQLDGSLLAPGAARFFTVWIDTRDLVLAGNLGFRNCAVLNHPHGKGKACSEGGNDIIVEKIGPKQCLPGEDCAFELKLINRSKFPFEGELLLSDHLFVGDKLVEAPISEIEPPLACKVEPTKLPFSCLASVKLAPGETLTHKILVEMPETSPVWVANCFAAADPWLVAEKKLLEGLLLPAKFKGKDVPPAAPACAWVKLDTKKVAKKAAKKGPEYVHSYAPSYGFIPPLRRCADGRAPLSNGRCPCPLSAPWDPETKSCRVRPICWDKARLSPDGYCCPRGTVWWPQTQSCRRPPPVGCRDAWRRAPDGSCCPRGTVWRNGACRPPTDGGPCKPGYLKVFSGVCIKLPPPIELPRCSDGRKRLSNGFCPPKACPLNAPFNAKTGRCEPLVVDGGGCKAGFVRLPGFGRCVPVGGCPGNLKRDHRGRCVPPNIGGDGGRPCPKGQRSINGKCIGVSLPVPLPLPPGAGPGVRPCPSGQKLINGKCIGVALPIPLPVPPKVTPPVQCPGNFVRHSSGKCVPKGLVDRLPDLKPCAPGQRRLSNGRCIGVPTKGVPVPIKPPGGVQPPVKPTPGVVAPVKPPVTVRPPVKPPVTVRPPVKPPVTVRPPVKPPVTVRPVKPPVTVRPVKPPVTVRPVKPPVTVRPVKPPVKVRPPVKPPVKVTPVRPPVKVRPVKPPPPRVVKPTPRVVPKVQVRPAQPQGRVIRPKVRANPSKPRPVQRSQPRVIPQRRATPRRAAPSRATPQPQQRKVAPQRIQRLPANRSRLGLPTDRRR